MVDTLRLKRLLRRVTDNTALLEVEAEAEFDRRSDAMWLHGVKYVFITAIESCVDIAQHICAAEGWGPPADNGDAIRLLGTHRVITDDLATRLRQAVGFCNVLVHDYTSVDDDIVTARLSDLSDLRQFVSQIGDLIGAGAAGADT